MNEIMESFKQSVKIRLSSPLIGAFIVSWFALNWKIVVTLFINSGSSSEIISDIAKYLNILDAIILPLFYSFLFIVIYPIISIGVCFLWEWTIPYKKE